MVLFQVSQMCCCSQKRSGETDSTYATCAEVAQPSTPGYSPRICSTPRSTLYLGPPSRGREAPDAQKWTHCGSFGLRKLASECSRTTPRGWGWGGGSVESKRWGGQEYTATIGGRIIFQTCRTLLRLTTPWASLWIFLLCCLCGTLSACSPANLPRHYLESTLPSAT